MSAITVIHLFRLLLNIVFCCPQAFLYFNKHCIPDEIPHDGISLVYKCE